MIALLGREFVNLPLLCGVAGHSHDASGPPTRGAFVFSLSTVILIPSHWHDSLSVNAQHPSVFVPFLSPARSAPSAPSARGCVILPAALSLSPSVCPGPLSLAQPPSWPLFTVCFQRRVLGPGVGWLRPPGTLPPSHCPPKQRTGQG